MGPPQTRGSTDPSPAALGCPSRRWDPPRSRGGSQGGSPQPLAPPVPVRRRRRTKTTTPSIPPPCFFARLSRISTRFGAGCHLPVWSYWERGPRTSWGLGAVLGALGAPPTASPCRVEGTGVMSCVRSRVGVGAQPGRLGSPHLDAWVPFLGGGSGGAGGDLGVGGGFGALWWLLTSRGVLYRLNKVPVSVRLGPPHPDTWVPPRTTWMPPPDDWVPPQIPGSPPVLDPRFLCRSLGGSRGPVGAGECPRGIYRGL